MTAEKLKPMEDETTIILVSDGKETCEGDPCALVKELRRSGIRFIMHVIGFDVNDEDRKQIECMAEAGGGTYYSAKNAGEFQMAARQVVEKQKFTSGILEVTAVKIWEPFGALVHVYRPGEKNELTHKYSSVKKPAVFKLLPGLYDIRVKDDANKSVKELNGVATESGKTQTTEVTFYRLLPVCQLTGIPT
jgi:Ca-activated chloride channel family protein